MFKYSNNEQELIESMERNLAEIQGKDDSKDKMIQAVDHLNRIAELFEDLGLTKEAEITTLILEKLGTEGANSDKIMDMIQEALRQKHKIPEKNMIEMKSILNDEPDHMLNENVEISKDSLMSHAQDVGTDNLKKNIGLLISLHDYFEGTSGKKPAININDLKKFNGQISDDMKLKINSMIDDISGTVSMLTKL